MSLRNLISRPDLFLSFSFVVTQYTGRFSDDFIEARRGDLERWMRRVTRHPVVRYSDGVVGFLGVEECEVSLRQAARLSTPRSLISFHPACPVLGMGPDVSDILGGPARWASLLRQVSRCILLRARPPEQLIDGPLFFASIFHPAYNLDLEDASSAIDKFSSHVSAVGRGVQHLREVMVKTRESERGRSSSPLYASHLTPSLTLARVIFLLQIEPPIDARWVKASLV